MVSRLIALFCALVPIGASAATYVVPSDYPTIEAAYQVTHGRDSILVRPGTYDLPSAGLGLFHDVFVISTDGPRTTILRNGLIAIAASSTGNHTATVVLQGFTLLDVNVLVSYRGAYATLTHGVIEDCVLLNSSVDAGTDVFLQLRSSLIVEPSAPIAVRVRFFGEAVGTPRAEIVNNTFVGCNTAMSFNFLGSYRLLIENNLIVDNDAGIVFENSFLPQWVTVSCNDLFGNTNDYVGLADLTGVSGNFTADPLFCDPFAGDYGLRSGSPCLPENHPDQVDCGLLGALGQECSGPIATEYVNWSALKNLYR